MAGSQAGRHLTFSQSFRFNDFAYAAWSHSILGSKSELIPRPTLEVFQAVGTLTGADGKASPLLAVVLGILKDVACRNREKSQLVVSAEEIGQVL